MSDRATSLSQLAAAGSAVLAVLLGAAYFVLRSELSLAQASDSLVDVVGGLVLLFAVKVGRQPEDAGHPMGHGRAEPLGALAIAALAVVLAIEVARSAVEALILGAEPRLAGVLLVLFGGKVAFKAVILLLARGSGSPAVRALAVDARNDVLVGAVAVLGFVAARFGNPSVDAWLALPLALYIGWSGVDLARENVQMLMGAAPTEERQQQLLELVLSCSDVLDAHDLRAQYLGRDLGVHVHIEVQRTLSVERAHDIGEEVRQRMTAESDVAVCSVHIDPYRQKEAC